MPIDSPLFRKLAPAMILGAAVVLASPPVFAQSAADKKAAAAEAAKAQKAFGAKKYADAASGYESANRKAPNPKYLIGAANARAKLGETVKAANLYAKAMKDGDAATKEEAKKGLGAVGPKLGQLEIKADGATSVAVDGDVVDTSVPLYFCQPGSRQVVAKFNDKEATLSPNVAAGVVTKVTLTAPESPVVAAKPAEEPKKEEPAPEKPKETASSGGKPFSPLVVYVGAGVTVVGIGLTIWSGLDTQKQKDTFDTDKSQANLDEGKSKQTRTNIFLGVTAAVGVFTAVAAIFFTDWNRKSTDANIKVGGGLDKLPDRQKPTVKFGAGPGSFAVYGTF